MFSCLLALISALFCVPVTTVQSCGRPSQLSANTSSSYLTSPNYPSNYPSSTTCEWTITAPPGYVLELSFVTFETEGNFSSLLGSCSSSGDILEIYNGTYRSSSQLRGKYCSHYLPANVYSSGTSLYLRFTSDLSLQKKGFQIKYRALIPRPNSTICSPFNTDYQNNNIQVSGSGYIESPLYGDKYPSSMQCTWVITVPYFMKIKLTFTDFVVGGRSYCSYSSSIYDHVQIRDGRYSYSYSLITLCGQSLPSPVYSSGRYMWIRFKSNSNNNNPRNTTGFKAKYTYANFFTTSMPPFPTRTTDWRTGSGSTSLSLSGFEIFIILGVCVLIFLVCICVCIALYKRRTPGHVTVQAPAVTQTTVQGTHNQPGTTFQYPRQMQGGFIVLPVHSGSSQASQSSHPPQASGYPQSYQQHPLPAGRYLVPATGGGTPAPGYPPRSSPSVPMTPYPQQPITDDPPPPYPGLPAEYHPQAATGQPAPSNPNPPYTPPQDVQGQSTSPPYPPAQDTTQASAPPPF